MHTRQKLGRNFDFFCFTKMIKSCASPVATIFRSSKPIDAMLVSNCIYDYQILRPDASSSYTSTRHQSNFAHSMELDMEMEPADLSTLRASRRFFFTSPGRSNSIVESVAADSPASSSVIPTTTTTTTSSNTQSSLDDHSLLLLLLSYDDDIFYRTDHHLAHHPANVIEDANEPSSGTDTNMKDSVAVSRLSGDPYNDFRKSMQEMVEARRLLQADVKFNWEHLHGLLSSYLSLNHPTTHNFILAAFADLLVTVLSTSSGVTT